ncbi:hypothetical protein EXU57_15270 [Segetibacter sp. 3557_3]|uniref:hypothetical protein n=1 Tax=Segetibacter sp. 3557_3 TaxID=2547429 RepID=UPI00105881AB|nr:hypothetical protein [Segetibacter sp. 3557_3]TDH24174.1 hypothetical protein EXU57_15270 [Segetibacter sp. 3557_3]
MEANLVINVRDLTEEFANGLMQVFSKDAMLNITVIYEPGGLNNPATQQPAKTKSGEPAKKRGRKPKVKESPAADAAPKKRGRKPKVVAD